MLGVSARFISRIECGESGVSNLTLVKLGALFKLPIDSFFVEHEDGDGVIAEISKEFEERHKRTIGLIFSLTDIEVEFLAIVIKRIKNKGIKNNGFLREEDY